MTSAHHRKSLCARLAVAAVVLLFASPLRAQSGGPAPFKDFNGYVAWMQKTHKAPFNRNAVMTPTAAKALIDAQAKTRAAQAQDHERPAQWRLR